MDGASIPVSEEYILGFALRAQRQETVGLLAAGAVHDFKNVLTVIEATLSLLGRRELCESNRKSLIDQASKSLSRGKRLAQQLLHLSRGDASGDTVCVAEMIQSLKPMFAAAIGPFICLNLDIEAGLPEVVADRAQLELVLLNLVMNARDAMAEGGTITIATDLVQACSVGNPTSYLKLCVRDTGHGMDELTLAHARELFFTTKRADEGTGLGLWLVQRFLSELGGNFSLSSEVGVGTVAELWFPVLDYRPAPDAPPFAEL